MLSFDYWKRHMKEEKDIARIDFAEHLRELSLSENSKVYWNERYYYVSKSRSDVQYLEKSTGYWSKDQGRNF